MKFLKTFWVPVTVVLLSAFVVWLYVSVRDSQGLNVAGKYGITQNLGNQVPLDAQLVDEKGKAVKLGDYFGKKPVVLMLIFYKCRGSCPLEFDGMTTALNSMLHQNVGQDFDIVSMSIHPKESPSVALDKKEQVIGNLSLAKRKSATAGWHFLTGKEDQVRKVADAVGFKYIYDEKTDKLVHATGIMVLTPTGRVSKYFYGTDYAAKLLRDNIVAAQTDKIGTQSEAFLFGCFQYDKMTGKTMVNVMRATQVAGFATVLVLGLSIFFMTRSSRAKAAAVAGGLNHKAS